MKVRLDTLDVQIVDLLTEDGRMPAKLIAQRIGNTTERVVRYRLKRLIDTGVISISAIVNPHKIGFPVIADVFIQVEAGRVAELAGQLAGYDNISYVAYSTGERDISVQIVARDNRELHSFVTEVIGQLPGVRRTAVSIVPLVLKDDARWRIPPTVLERQ